MINEKLIFVFLATLVGCNEKNIQQPQVLKKFYIIMQRYFDEEHSTIQPMTLGTVPSDDYGDFLTTPLSESTTVPSTSDVTESSPFVFRVKDLSHDHDLDIIQPCYRNNVLKMNAKDWILEVFMCINALEVAMGTTEDNVNALADCNPYVKHFENCVERNVILIIKNCFGDDYVIVYEIKRHVHKFGIFVCDDFDRYVFEVKQNQAKNRAGMVFAGFAPYPLMLCVLVILGL